MANKSTKPEDVAKEHSDSVSEPVAKEIIDTDISADMSLSDVLRSAWNMFLDNIKLMAIFGAILAAPSILVALAVGDDDGGFFNTADTDFLDEGNAALFFFGLIASFIVAIVVNAMVVPVFMQMAKTGRKFTFSEAREYGFQYIGRVILVALLVGIVVTLGFIALIVPGVIALLFLVFAVPEAIEEDSSVTDAFKGSRKLFNANAGMIIGWMAISIGIGIVSSIIFLPLAAILSFIPVVGQYVVDAASGAISFYFTLGFMFVYYVSKKKVEQLDS